VLKSDVNRREFLKLGAASGAVLAMPAVAWPNQSKTMIGIQLGAVSFVDEGTEQVLDNLQERARVNTLFLAVFTYGRGIAGRQIPGQPLPDHGKQEYDLNFHGGNFATPQPEFYKNTVLKETRAPDHGNLDILAEVLPGQSIVPNRIFTSSQTTPISSKLSCTTTAAVNVWLSTPTMSAPHFMAISPSKRSLTSTTG